MDIFVGSASGLNNPQGLAFGLNGNLFVASMGDDRVVEFDAQTGNPVGDFITAGPGALDGPTRLLLDYGTSFPAGVTTWADYQ